MPPRRRLNTLGNQEATNVLSLPRAPVPLLSVPVPPLLGAPPVARRPGPGAACPDPGSLQGRVPGDRKTAWSWEWT
jgi:hypothetical protein